MPPDPLSDGADTGGGAVDDSAWANLQGAEREAAIARQEAAEIAAVPDPESPEGQAAILAIIQKYQAYSAGNVETDAVEQQATGTRAATSKSGSADGDGDADEAMSGMGSTSLMDILGSLLGTGGMGGMSSMMNPGMSPFGQSSPFGQTDPFGSDPYAMNPQPSLASTASDPFAAVPGSTPGAGTLSTGYNAAADPFATLPSTGSSGEGIAGETGEGDAASPPDAPLAAATPSAGVDTSAFGGPDGAAVPADPAAG